MKFKTPESEQEFLALHPVVRTMGLYFESLCKAFSIEPTVTRVLGKIQGDSGVHAVGRAIDFRDETCESPGKSFWIFTQDQRDQILSAFNSRYPRDDGKQSLMWHSFQGMPHHFHLQAQAKALIQYDQDIAHATQDASV